MNDLSFQRSRHDENFAKLIYLHNFSKSNVEISWIKELNLTYFCKFFRNLLF